MAYSPNSQFPSLNYQKGTVKIRIFNAFNNAFLDIYFSQALLFQIQ